MQIRKSPYMFVCLCSYKQYLENFAFLILRIIELFAREVLNFLKCRRKLRKNRIHNFKKQKKTATLI